jgi:hypothetical protein
MTRVTQQRRRVVVRADDDGKLVSIEAMIVVQPGYLMRSEVDDMRKVIADKLMVFLANEVPYLNVHLSDVKVSR